MDFIPIDINAIDVSKDNIINGSIEAIKKTFGSQFDILRKIIENQGCDLVRKSFNCNEYSIFHKYKVTKAEYNPMTRELEVSVEYDFLGKGKEKIKGGFWIKPNDDSFHIYKTINVINQEIKQVIDL